MACAVVSPQLAASASARPCAQPLRPAASHRCSAVQPTALRRQNAVAARQRRRLLVRAAAEEPATALSSTDVPPGCSRYTVQLPKPLGLVLEEGEGGRGVYVAEIAEKGNAAALAPEIQVGDELIATTGLTFTTEQVYNDNIVRGGEKIVRVNVRNNSFDTVMAAIGSIKPPTKVTLEFQRCE